MPHPLNNLIPDFREREAERVHAKAINAGPSAGAAPPTAEATLIQIADSHLAGSGMQTIQVPIGADSGGVQSYIDHPIWPTTTPGTYADLLAIVEALSLQGELADCYALSAMNSAIFSNYAVLKSRIVALPDGTIGVYGFYQGQPITFVMDYNMAAVGVSVGAAGLIAYKVFEKVWAFARYLSIQNGVVTSTIDDYTRENSGWMTEVFNLLGIPAQNIAATLATIISIMQANVAAGKAVSFGTPATVTNGYIDDHAYAVDDKMNSVNPWGVPYPPMLKPIQQADVSNYGTTVCVADLSKASPVPAQPVVTVTPTPTPVNPPEVPMTAIILPPAGTTFTADRYSAISGCRVETQNGVEDIGYPTPGCYVEYALTVAVAAAYTFSTDFAATSPATATVSVNGSPAATIQIPSTASWSKFAAVPTAITLPTGNVTVRIQQSAGSYNVGATAVTPGGVPIAPTPPAKTPKFILYTDGTWSNA